MPRIGLIGVGPWGSNYIGPLMTHDSLSALVDVDAAALSKAHAPANIGRFRTLDELLARGPHLDGIVVASPAGTHFDLARQALLAGLGVLVEKPFALTLSQAADLYELADRQGATLMSGHLLLHSRGLYDLWKETTSGNLGDIAYLRSTRTGIGRIRSEEDVLWSFGSHDISMILTLMGRMPDSVRAQKYRLRGVAQADLAIVGLSFTHAAHASIHLSWLGPERERRLLVYAKNGTASFDDARQYHHGVMIHTLDQLDSGNAGHENTDERTEHDSSPMRPLDRQVGLFCHYLSRSLTPQEDRSITLGVISLLQAADSSDAENRTVSPERDSGIDSTQFKPSNAWAYQPSTGNK